VGLRLVLVVAGFLAGQALGKIGWGKKSVQKFLN
jgi:hypothetical protein